MKSRIVPISKVICDDCSGEFDLKIEKAEIEPDIIEQYFQCPHCGARTTITITDSEMRAKIERRKQLRKDYVEAAKKRVSYQKLKRFLREDAKLKDELMQASKEMKKKYHRGDEESDENQIGGKPAEADKIHYLI